MSVFHSCVYPRDQKESSSILREERIICNIKGYHTPTTLNNIYMDYLEDSSLKVHCYSPQCCLSHIHV